jgi:hypothetical protein
VADQQQAPRGKVGGSFPSRSKRAIELR